MVSVLLVAPEIVPPLARLVEPLRHWKVKPEAVVATLKLTEVPEQTVCVASGCILMLMSWLTFKTAFEEVTDIHGAKPLTTTL